MTTYTGVSLYKLITNEFQNYLFVNTIPMMNTISREIEDVVMENNLPVDFYAGFQRYSFFLRQRRRYERLAKAARRVFVFGIPDVEPPTLPGIEFIPLDASHNLTQEWFLVVNTPYFFTSLLTREIEGQDTMTSGRKFQGIWTHDEKVVSQAYLILAQHLNQDYQPINQRDYYRQNNYIVSIANKLVTQIESSNVAYNRTQRLSEAISKVADSVSKNQGNEQLLEQVVNDLQSSFKSRNVTLWQPAGQDEMELVAAAGLPSNWRRALYRRQLLNDTEVLAAQVLKTQAIAQVMDTQLEKLPDPFDPAVRTIIAVPLQARGQFLGALQLTDHLPQAYSAETAQSLQVIGTQIALAMLGMSEAIALPTPAAPPEEMAWTVLNSTLDGIIILNADRTLKFVNSCARQWLKAPEGPLAKQPIGILHNDDLEYIVASLEPKLGMIYGELRLQGKPYLVGVAPAYNDDGTGSVTHWTIVIRDLVNAVGAEELKEANSNTIIARLKIGDELVNRVQTVNQLLQKVTNLGQLSQPQARAIEQIGQLHEEMTQIAGQLTKFEHEGQDKEHEMQTKALTQKLLWIDKARASQGEREAIQLRELVKGVLAQFVSLAAQRGITLNEKVPADLPVLYANSDQIRQVLVELVDNALKYNMKGVEVSILAHSQKEMMNLAVRDTGIGLWPKDIPFLFEPFYRVRSPQTLRIDGRGLGLAFVKAVALGHGGRTWVSSKMGQGSTFLMELPLIAKTGGKN